MDLDRASASEIAHAVRKRAVAAADVARHFLLRIERAEPSIQAFAFLDPEAVLRQARAIDAASQRATLAGVPVGVKDIYDTAGMPTEFFSPSYRGNRPSRDAFLVGQLRAAGAIVIGKTATTEFAYLHAGPSRNPHDPSRTPGSSSAGSGAGMAAGFFPLATGSQTAGSLLKPASYCGVFAYKPTFGLVSLEGVKPLAPSFDTAGWYGRSVEDLALVARTLVPGLPVSPTGSRLRLAAVAAPHTRTATAHVRAAFEEVCERLRKAGHGLDELRVPPEFEGAYEDHRIINDAEGARSLSPETQTAPLQLSPEIQAMIARADATPWNEEMTARTRYFVLRDRIEPLVAEYDAVLDLSTHIEAPLGLASTGPSDTIKVWNGFGFPQISIPALTGQDEMPVGLQLFAARYSDATLLASAETIAADLGCPILRPLSLDRLSAA